EDVAMVSLAAHLLGVLGHRLVAVVAVGYEQLGVAGRILHGRDRARVGGAPHAVDGAVGVRDLGPRRLPGRRLERGPRRPGGIGVQREDGGDVGARGAREAQAVLLGPGMGALVRAHAAGPVSLDAHAAEEPTPREPFASGAFVLLGVNPECRLAVTDQRAL